MLRSLLVGLLVVSGASACSGKGGDAPAVEPGKAVGKVVEITGKVTATRGTQTRDLDASSSVSGDDVITTAADGRVTILLAHNNAKWDLGPNKHEQVATSMAWKLAKVDAPAGTVDETTTAAGRHAERNAANGESAAGARIERAPAATTTEPAPGAAPDGKAPPRTGGESDPRADVDEPAKTDVRQPPSPPKAVMVPKAEPRGRKEEKGGGGIGARGEGAVDDGLVTRDAKQEKAKIATPPAPDPTATAITGGGGSVNPLAAAIEKERAALRQCVVKSGKDTLAIAVHFAKGVATITLAEGSAADKACVAKVAARIKLTVDSADYSTVIAK